MKTIRTAAVIGSGVMGAGIAAHLANSGLNVLLLDIVPERLTPDDEASGKSLADRSVRNRLAGDALTRLSHASPAAFFDDSCAGRIKPGNVEDDFAALSGVDWIIEAITEKLDVKKQLLTRIEAVWSPGTVVSSNTSGISIEAMAEAIAGPMKAFFLGAHFFNPPRYMQLVELIPGSSTNEAVVAAMKTFLERRLGKGVVVAKDTPNFIANRIGTYGLLATMNIMEAGGYTVGEIDAVTGPALGRPKSATFRTLDLVGLDTFIHVANNVAERTDDAAEKLAFAVPDRLADMVRRGWLGEKSGQGFYKKVKEGGASRILELDLASMAYVPASPVRSASLDAAKTAKGAAAKVKAVLAGDDRYSALAWSIVRDMLLYAAEKVERIADSIADIDKAMRLGFNWDLGPFELWDAIGLRQSVTRMGREGRTVPGWVKNHLDGGNESFYVRQPARTFYVRSGELKELEEPPEQISLRALKAAKRTVLSSPGASLIDIGEEVACLEFHSPNNAIGADILTMIRKSVETVRNSYKGLVIANEGRNFCVGANLMLLLMEAQEEEWDEVDRIIRLFQNAMLELKRLEKPVVAAPHRMTLGGGVEVCMAADRVVAHAETYYGLVEPGVGLIPAGGGSKEMALRAAEATIDPDGDLQPALNRAFETIGLAKVSGSAPDAVRMGLMRRSDRSVMNRDLHLYEARRNVLDMELSGYIHGGPQSVKVAGRDGKALLTLGALTLLEGGRITKHDFKIASKLGHVLAGGNVPAGTAVTESYLLDLEREAFLSLCGEPKTRARMQHMLATGKPLRN
ncbi:3-hydroxyacyl-CoA dehydrogenase/enoyl-CoA hydratase family protein [Paenibacillus ginsengarvi]|uniref:3-hydroxyacyl-CoA dehydrogenase/enoyl-CoA hydratase family protein n=1 Tax=Paenibacillus ginsengarvi TaxID=400777 RepID=A0A3B0CIP5_9BACL|nr:3-hydroxyacyl-CoA dehydrogenase/enoyl-CoA hydratase family protein [Paenibacillus ginsengarvi]RKN84177.1 3-hydroxyacyl-CoA dehydrogenase/enoyl-CoA hydratase family protein [Paenibacillus ginsengarvi]